MTPGFERLGLRVTEPERMAMISGEQPSQTLLQRLCRSAYGCLQRSRHIRFPRAGRDQSPGRTGLTQLNEQARAEREMQKYFGLIRGGVYANSPLRWPAAKSANETYTGKWAGMMYWRRFPTRSSVFRRRR